MIQLLSRFGERTRRRLRGADRLDAGCKPALTPKCAVMDSGTTGVQNLESINMYNKGNKNLRVANPQGLRKIIFLILCTVFGGSLLKATPLVYTGSTPVNESKVSSFDDITLHFDLSNIIETYGDGDWGIGCSGYYNKRKPTEQQSAALYKGTPDSGECLSRIYNTVKPADAGFVIGSDFHLSFPDIQVEPDELYTLVLTYDFYAGRKGESSWISDTKYSFFENPISLTFYGGSDVSTVLLLENHSVDSSTIYEQLPNVTLTFNHDVIVTGIPIVSVFEDSVLIGQSVSIESSSDNAKSVLITFPDTQIYNGHKYTINVPEGCIAVANEPDVVNSAIDIEINGASYRSFGTGRVRPSNGSVTVMGEITVPFKFPEVEGKNYGFVAQTDASNFTGYLYLGDDFTKEPVEIMEGGVTADSKGLVFNPKTVFEPETAYTFVIPEGNVKAYEIGSMTQAYLKDYISERVELHYTTPAVSDLPIWSPTAVNLKDNETKDFVDYFIIDCPDYEYDEILYNTVSSKTLGDKGVIYEVTADGDKEIATFPITRQTLTGESEIGNGQYVGRHFVGVVNQELYAGKTYKMVMKPNSFIVDNPFIGNHIGNQEVAVTINGGTRTEFDVTYLISDGASMTTTVSKGSTPSFKVAAPENWVVESVNFNEEAMEAVNGKYTTPAIEDDATVTVVYAFDGEIQFVDLSTGVEDVTIGDSDYTVGKDGVYVVIKGLTNGDNVTIYTVNGQVVGQHTANLDTLKIELPTGMYIIRVNNVTFKIKH